ncbi:EAL domain-containing protein [Dryocola sp. BD613]|uniref:EAL domain-containing protein n=1 Tax=Dryocola sp. BD613 TaxID=3133272 RepID=UPI003F50B1AE
MEAFPYIQPVICAATQRLIGAEVLLRFRDSQSHDLAADTTINKQALDKFTVKLIDEVHTRFYPLRNKLPQGFFFSFNICASQLSQPELKKTACNFSDDFNLMLEVNERSIDATEAPMLDSIQEMRNAGIQFAIDDFGAGCASLKYLEKMDFCLLKLNRDLTLTHQGELLYKKTLSALSGLAIMLDIRLGAEGVQTGEQARRLVERGVNLLQGNYYSRPLTVETFIVNYVT